MLHKLDVWMTRIENAISGSLFIGSLLILAWNIFMRKAFRDASTWAEEAIRYAIIWVTFIGSSQCAKAGAHVGIDIVVEMLPQKSRKYVNALSSFLASAFCVFCGCCGVALTHLVVANHRVSAAMQMPMWILYISIPLGFLLTAVRFVIIGVGRLRESADKTTGLTDASGELDISKM